MVSDADAQGLQGLAVNVTETAVDDPDAAFYENYFCGAARNYTGYCNAEVDKLIDKQSAESDTRSAKRSCGKSRRS